MITFAGGGGAGVVVVGVVVVVVVVGTAIAAGVARWPPLVGTSPQLVNVAVARMRPSAVATEYVRIMCPFGVRDVRATMSLPVGFVTPSRDDTASEDRNTASLAPGPTAVPGVV